MESSAKLFADDTSLFSIVYDLSKCANLLNDDLKKILEWAFKWKVSRNPDMTEQANKLKKSFFSCKNTKSDHPIVFLKELLLYFLLLSTNNLLDLIMIMVILFMTNLRMIPPATLL